VFGPAADDAEHPDARDRCVPQPEATTPKGYTSLVRRRLIANVDM
jgi:hypothetical protein